MFIDQYRNIYLLSGQIDRLQNSRKLLMQILRVDLIPTKRMTFSGTCYDHFKVRFR